MELTKNFSYCVRLKNSETKINDTGFPYTTGDCIVNVLGRTPTQDGNFLNIKVIELASKTDITEHLKNAQKLCPVETKNRQEYLREKSVLSEIEKAYLDDPDDWMLLSLYVTVYDGRLFVKGKYTIFHHLYKDEDDDCFYNFFMVREKKDNGDINWFYYQYIYNPDILRSFYLFSGYLDGEYLDGEDDKLRNYSVECSEKFGVEIYNENNLDKMLEDEYKKNVFF